MGINALQVAWLSRLRAKGVLAPGQSMIEFSPQDVYASRRTVELYARAHNTAAVVDAILREAFDGDVCRPSGIPAFYRLFGIERYRSMDAFDRRSDWIRDFNVRVDVGEQFDIATNFGTAEHIFNIGQVFRSMHEALRPGGVALHVLPTFGDINHGFYNIHPTVYFDLAVANDYKIEDFCYVDRWDIRNKMLEAEILSDIDFEVLPIRAEHMRDGALLQRMVTEQFVKNYHDPETQRFGSTYPSILYDYCCVALRKNGADGFRLPMQSAYGGGVSTRSLPAPDRLKWLAKRIPNAVARRVRRGLGAVKSALLGR